MTPERCITVAQGRRYIGVFLDTCYAADTLDFVTPVQLDSCNLLCPGDARQLCGGVVTVTSPVPRNIRPWISRRAAPANILLTIYGIPIGLLGTTVVGPGTTVVMPPATIVGPGITTTEPGVTIIGLTTILLPNVPGGTVVPSRPLTIIGPSGALIPTAVPISGSAITSMVTTVTYTTVDSARPTALVLVTLCTTLYFENCHCPTQVIPTVPMTTYEAKCDRCGHGGKNTVTLTVP
ncbi:uncharacterized protein LY79DRAFT_475200, partial [Colletotrichum navitas]